MSQQLLLRGAKQLLTLRGNPSVRRGADFDDLAIIPDGSVLIRDGKIVSVGPTRRLENTREARDALDVPVHGCVVMPAFVDAGIQLSLFETAKQGARQKRKKPADFRQEGINLMRSCLQHGTLTAGIKAYSEVGNAGSDLAGMRQLARIGNNPVTMVRLWGIRSRSKGSVADTLAIIRKHRLTGVLELNGQFDEESDGALLSEVGGADMDISLNWTGSDPDRLHQILRATSPSAVFCGSNLSTAERAVLAQSNSTAIFKAGRQLLEEKPGGCLRELADSGGAIALSSGYDAEEEMNFNMQWVLALAVMRLRLSVEEAIVASTINAAYAMNCGDEVGSLEVNKRAEILVLNLEDYRELPRRMGMNHVGMVIRNGNIALNRTRWRVGAA